MLSPSTPYLEGLHWQLYMLPTYLFAMQSFLFLCCSLQTLAGRRVTHGPGLNLDRGAQNFPQLNLTANTSPTPAGAGVQGLSHSTFLFL